MFEIGAMRRVAVAVGLAGLLLSSAGDVRAQAAGDLQQQFEQAFEHMLQDPANLDKSFKYAELGIQVGDYEAAITALERMLLYNPDLPRVRLELGVLYFRLGSYAIARSYLTRAVVGENVPDDVRARVAVFLDEIDNRLSNHRFSGSVYGGMRYQTNANSGPERAAIRLLDTEAVLDGEFVAKVDWNAFVSTSFRHVYDPQSHSGDVLETDLLVYVSRQTNQHQLDLVFSEITVGPRGQFLREYIENASWRPHIVGSMVNLDASPYYYTWGAGVDIDKQLTTIANGSVSASYVQKSYRADAGRSTARLQSGAEADFEANLRIQVSDSLLFTWTAGFTNLDTEDSLHANTEYSFGLGATMRHAPPKYIDRYIDTGPWTTSLSGTTLSNRYHAPDSSIDTFKKRRDREYRASLLTSIPIKKSWSVTTTVSRTSVGSNFLNYSYNNWAASVGASVRF